MRLVRQNIERKDGSGSATLLPEEPEDMVSMSVCGALCQLGTHGELRPHDSGTPTT